MVGQGDRDRTLGFLSKELRKERKGKRCHEWKGVDASLNLGQPRLNIEFSQEDQRGEC